MITVNSTNEQDVVLTADPRTEAGNPAQVDGNLMGEVLEGAVEVEEISGTQIRLKNASLGLNRVRVYADADLGEGVRNIEEEVIYVVNEAEAFSLGLSVTTELRPVEGEEPEPEPEV